MVHHDPSLCTMLAVVRFVARVTDPMGPVIFQSQRTVHSALQVSVTKVCFSTCGGKASAGGETHLSCKAFKSAVSSSIKSTELSGWSFWSFLLKDLDTRTKSEDNSGNILQNTRRDFSSVTAVSGYKSNLYRETNERSFPSFMAKYRDLGTCKTSSLWV